MEALIKQIAKIAGLSDEDARNVMDTAREVLEEKMSPEQMERVDEMLSDEKKAEKAGKLVAKLGQKAINAQRKEDSAGSTE